MSEPLVTILVPNYKTLDLTKLCLRLLRQHTPPALAKVIVIDNDSQDASLDYLRTLSWIELIERKAIPGEAPVASHSRALDLALSRVTTPYVLSIHTDTLVKRSDWLLFLIAQIEKSPTIAGVGSWKLEAKPIWRRALKNIEHYAQLLFYKITRKKHALQGVGENFLYLRSHCAMYRMDAIKKYGLSFSDGDRVAGKGMHQKLVDAGHAMVFLKSETLIQYLDHINHATVVLNPSLSTREKSVIKGQKRIQAALAAMNAEMVLANEALDA